MTAWNQCRTLVPAFLGRFFEAEAAADSHSLKTSIFFLVVFLALPGLFAPLIIGTTSIPWIGEAGWGWDMVARYRGVDVLRAQSLSDKALYLGAAMAAMGVIVALTWQSLLTDRRDALVLGMLPVRPAVVVAARLAALVWFAGLVTAGMHLLASASFGFFLAAGNTWTFLVRGVVAHFVASVAAGAFVLFGVAAVQGLTLAVIGPKLFARVSAPLQLLLVAAIVAGLAMLPGLATSARDVLSPVGDTTAAGSTVLLAPPTWFLGLYETVLGTDRPLNLMLASRALWALAIVAGATVVGYALAYRRLMSSAIERSDDGGRRARLARFGVWLVGRDSAVRGVAEFALLTVTRIERHRFMVAAGLGAGIAWGLPAWIAFRRAMSAEPTTAVLSIAFSALLFVLLGLRLAMAVPADLRAAWVFDFSRPSWHSRRRAAERLLVAFGVAPIVLVSSLTYLALWGWSAALTHAGFMCAIGFTLIQIFLRRFDGMPCAEAWRPAGASLKAIWPVYLFGFTIVTAGLPALERNLFRSPAAALAVVSFWMALALLLRRLLLHRPPSAPADEEADLFESVRPTVSNRPGVTSADGARNAAGFDAGVPMGEPALFGAFQSAGWIGRLSDALTFTRRGLASRARSVPRPGLSGVEGRGLSEVEGLFRDVLMALRRVRQRPAFTVFAIATIALGVGATASVYAIAHAVLLKPADIRDIDRVMNIYNARRGSFANITMSWLDYQDLRAMQTAYSEITAFTPSREVLTGAGASQVVMTEAVGGEFFQLVGAPVVLGRPLQPDDDRPDAPLAIVLSHTLWRTTFAARADVIGQSVRLNGQLFEVTGVLSAGFTGVFAPHFMPTQAWVPLSAARHLSSRWSEDRDSHWLLVKGRLADGRSEVDARREVNRIADQLDAAFPIDPSDARYQRHWATVPARDSRLYEGMSHFALPFATVLMVAVGLVLLIACTNLANLTLARGATRRHETAVQLALGAARHRLMRELIVDASIVAAAGTGLGWLMARGFTHAFASGPGIRLAPGVSADVVPTFSASVWLVLAASALLSVIVCGVWPAWRLTRVSARELLGEESNTVAGRGWQGRRALVAVQVGASVVLLATATLFGGEMASRVQHDTGIALDRLAITELMLPETLRGHPSFDAMVARVLDGFEREPGIQAVAFSSGLPLERLWTAQLSRAGEDPVSTGLVDATPQILDVLGVRLRFGRMFQSVANRAALPEIVLSELTARQLFGGLDVVGRIAIVRTFDQQTGTPHLIVGISADTDVGSVGNRVMGMVYRPLREPPLRPVVLARVDGDPAIHAALLRDRLPHFSPDAAVVEATTGRVTAGLSGGLSEAVAGLTGVLGVAALAMSMVGLFGVLSQRVADRRRELGLRTALGAGRRELVRLVVLDGLRPVMEGLLIGIWLGALLRLAAQPFFPRAIPAVDWTMLLVVPALLVVAAAAACYLPARRAAVVDPAVTLRAL